MSLTKRRLQFLQKLVDLYQKTNLPIHYEALAQSIGVSKWTAYDMLKEIEKLGFISRSYEVNSKETGRSQVVFIPTPKASGLFDQPRSETIDWKDWEATMDHISRLLLHSKSHDMNEALHMMIVEVSKTTTKISFCAYILGLLMMYLKKLGEKTASFIQNVVSKAQSKQMGMTLFVGTTLGTAIQSLNDELGLEMTELVGQFLKSIADLSNEEQSMLSQFLEEAF